METTITDKALKSAFSRKRILIEMLLWELSQNPEFKAFCDFVDANPNYIWAWTVHCCGQSANVMMFAHGTAFHYVILYPWGTYKKGIYNVLEHLDGDFYTEINEEIQCDIAINSTPPIPRYRVAEIFKH